ncbi:procathepsin L-like [Drosophila kikkawai]|uniref:Procathepsin L-like n=1 Tax=Drosophila kikkawai TaxID=30033 RepID=A0A6P4ISE3_DROKI|nr:procathepsin L-like [Drosophila kikkawai]
MDYFPVLKLIALLLLVDLGYAAGNYQTYDQLPKGIDWRRYGYISPVQNQGGCQASWAMSAVGAVEAHLGIKNRRLDQLSVQQLIDCASNYGCGGGWASVAFNYTRDHGIASKTSYPYRAEQSTCSYDPSTSAGRIRSYVTLRYADEKCLAEVVYNIGPVVVHLDSLHDSVLEYKSGIYREEDCRFDMAYLTEAVLVVGFGTDSNYGDYWILKTSFGKNWGENGYMRLARNAGNMCGVATLAQYPIV